MKIDIIDSKQSGLEGRRVTIITARMEETIGGCKYETMKDFRILGEVKNETAALRKALAGKAKKWKEWISKG